MLKVHRLILLGALLFLASCQSPPRRTCQATQAKREVIIAAIFYHVGYKQGYIRGCKTCHQQAVADCNCPLDPNITIDPNLIMVY
jgi:hypothetical protein